MSRFIFIILLSISNFAFAGWIPAELISEENVVYNPRIAANEDNIHVIYSVDTGGDDEVYYLNSPDNGVTWWPPRLMVDTSEAAIAVLPVIQTAGDTVYAIWRNYFIEGGRNLSFRRSLNNGGSWQPVQYLLHYNHYAYYMFNFCVSGRKVYVIFEDQNNGFIFYFIRSTNGGQTWTDPVEMFRCYQAGEIDMASRGDTIHFVWYGDYSLDDRLETYYTRSINAGNTWSENQILSEPDTIGSHFPSITINDRGHMAVCWMDGKYSPHPWNGDLFIRYSYDSGIAWTPEEQITFNHWAYKPHVIWKGDSLHVAWQDDSEGNGSIYYMLSQDNGQTWKQEERLDYDPERSETPDIAISNSGKHVVWKDNRNYPGGVYYARWEPDVSIDNIIPSEYQTALIAYPNPFNSTILISYLNLEGGDIEIYDITGRLVKTFITRGIKEGPHGSRRQDQATITWDATDAAGKNVCSGAYFIKAQTSAGVQTAKVVFLK